jgi:hypothetical protein
MCVRSLAILNCFGVHMARTKKKKNRDNSPYERPKPKMSFAKALKHSNMDAVLASIMFKPPSVRTMARRNTEGRTALHLACVQGRPDVVASLIAIKADTNHPDAHASTPLILAARFGSVSCVRHLLDCGRTHIDAKNMQNDAALTWAAARDDASVALALLEAKANIELTDHSLSTPLIVAAKKNSLKVASVLIQFGANVHVKNRENEGIMDVCQNVVLPNRVEPSFKRAAVTSLINRCVDRAGVEADYLFYQHVKATPAFALAASPGLNLTDILRTHLASTPKHDALYECSICCEGRVDPGLVSTVCGHVICPLCVVLWVGNKRKRTCPTCRAAVQLDSFVRIRNLTTLR